MFNNYNENNSCVKASVTIGKQQEILQRKFTLNDIKLVLEKDDFIEEICKALDIVRDIIIKARTDEKMQEKILEAFNCYLNFGFYNSDLYSFIKEIFKEEIEVKL